jgi:5-methylcytosine-specific restriction protein A
LNGVPTRPPNHNAFPLNPTQRRPVAARPSSAQRGYGARWQKASKAYLRVHRFCVIHLAKGRHVPATVVDHKEPHKGDMQLFWDNGNWQSLCKPCHDHKTATEDGGFGHRKES